MALSPPCSIPIATPITTAESNWGHPNLLILFFSELLLFDAKAYFIDQINPITQTVCFPPSYAIKATNIHTQVETFFACQECST